MVSFLQVFAFAHVMMKVALVVAVTLPVHKVEWVTKYQWRLYTNISFQLVFNVSGFCCCRNDISPWVWIHLNIPFSLISSMVIFMQFLHLDTCRFFKYNILWCFHHCVCVFMCSCACNPPCREVRRQLIRVRLGDRCLFPLSHLAGPHATP